LLCYGLLVQPLKRLGGCNSKIQQGLAAAERVFQVLDTPKRITDIRNAKMINTFNTLIKLENVSFSYDTGDEVLKDINLMVKRGEVIAIVGPSGGGKSTLVDLIPRFYDPKSGSITIDGENLKELKLTDLRGLMGIVTQEIILFNDTIWNNIAYGLENITEEQMYNAAKAANADNFIMEFHKKYQTIIGDRGTKLSGGQRQRIAIARAILKNPPILIFDEATSALDTESELQVQEALEHLMTNRTTFVIAHRLSTVQNADKIIVIDKGVQEGKHNELLEIGGLYKKLYDMQFNIQ